MRRSDDVFFFTLIDFLLQVFFFGLLLFVVGQTLQSAEKGERDVEEQKKAHLLKAFGVSNITELTDALTKMAPLDKLRGTADYIARNGGVEPIRAAVDAARAAGGSAKVSTLNGQVAALTERLAKLEGWGKVSCIPNITVNGTVRPKSIATVVVSDDGVVLQEPTQEMHTLLNSLGLQFDGVKSLSLGAFRSTFAPIVTKQPECRYFLDVVTHTRYLEPMRVIWSAFRTQ